MNTDLSEVGISSSNIPQDISSIERSCIQGAQILQINEMINVNQNLEKRFQDSPQRLIKFCLTDGKQILFGMEFKRFPTISVNSLPGIKVFLFEKLKVIPNSFSSIFTFKKILIQNVIVRYGLLLLTPENTTFLGGKVQRLVDLRDQV